MGKILLALTVILLSSTCVCAQGFSGGFRIGVNFANQKIHSDVVNISPGTRRALHLGFFATIMVSRNFGIQPELLYSSMGSKFEDANSIEVINMLEYLSIPIMLRYNPVKGFNFHAGPQLGFLLAARQEQGAYGQGLKEGYKGFDFGLGIGAGLDAPTGMGLIARYVVGLSNVAAVEDGQDGKLTNNVFQLSVTYKLFGR